MLRCLIFALALTVPLATAGAAETIDLISLVNGTTASDWQYTPIPKADGDGQQEARSGCCSHHGGVAGCDYDTGHQRCADGSDSPTCGCGE
jgi:hypothetical protein